MVGAFFGFFLVLWFPGGWAEAAEGIRISVSGSYNMIFLSAGVAQKKGFFEAEGLDADIVVMRAATLIRACRLIRENREEAVKVLAAWGKVGQEHAYASYDSTVKVISADGTIPSDGLRLLIDLARKDAKIAREIPLGEVADFRILKEAQRELGLH